MPDRMPYTLILFDLDGTLAETAPEIQDAVNDTLAECQLPLAGPEQVQRWIGHGTRALLLHALAHASGQSEEQVRQWPELPAITAAFDRHYAARSGTRARLYPHARQSLCALRACGVKLAVVTNKEARHTQRVLHALGLLPLLDRVISGDSLPSKKPDPAGVLACMREFGASPARTLFVGDSSIDAATARNAGIAIWLLPHGYNMGEPVHACAPDRVLHHGFASFMQALQLCSGQGSPLSHPMPTTP
ncbi:MAG: HAD-IA family hydrolase [Pseudomonadota bacterium]|nr:HAD-IA family hydrolase [Pseudomonadota bacterium]